MFARLFCASHPKRSIYGTYSGLFVCLRGIQCFCSSDVVSAPVRCRQCSSLHRSDVRRCRLHIFGPTKKAHGHYNNANQVRHSHASRGDTHIIYGPRSLTCKQAHPFEPAASDLHLTIHKPSQVKPCLEKPQKAHSPHSTHPARMARAPVQSHGAQHLQGVLATRNSISARTRTVRARDEPTKRWRSVFGAEPQRAKR